MVISWCDNSWLESGVVHIVDDLTTLAEMNLSGKNKSTAAEVIIIANDNDITHTLQNMSKLSNEIYNKNVLVITDLIPERIIINLLDGAQTIRIANSRISVIDFILLFSSGIRTQKQDVASKNHRLLLTRREKSVVMSFCMGVKPKDLAWRVGLSIKTISYYKRSIMNKLGISNQNNFYRFINGITYSDINNYL